MSSRNGTKWTRQKKNYFSLGNPLRMCCVSQERLLRQTLGAKVPPSPLTSHQHFQTRGSTAVPGLPRLPTCSDEELPWLHTHTHTVPPPCPHSPDKQTGSVWHLHQQQDHWLSLVLAATVQLCPAGTSLQGASCTQVTAPCTGGIMTGTYRFQQHSAPPDCMSAFKERADIWASWPLSTWGRIPKYNFIPAKWLQPGGHQDIAWYSYTWMKTTACWLYKRFRR